MDESSFIKCESCGNSVFIEGCFLRKISAIESPNGKEMIQPIQVFTCAACGHLNSELDVEEIEKQNGVKTTSKLII